MKKYSLHQKINLIDKLAQSYQLKTQAVWYNPLSWFQSDKPSDPNSDTPSEPDTSKPLEPSEPNAPEPSIDPPTQYIESLVDLANQSPSNLVIIALGLAGIDRQSINDPNISKSFREAANKASSEMWWEHLDEDALQYMKEEYSAIKNNPDQKKFQEVNKYWDQQFKKDHRHGKVRYILSDDFSPSYKKEYELEADQKNITVSQSLLPLLKKIDDEWFSSKDPSITRNERILLAQSIRAFEKPMIKSKNNLESLLSSLNPKSTKFQDTKLKINQLNDKIQSSASIANQINPNTDIPKYPRKLASHKINKLANKLLRKYNL